jgi:alanyl-tRNA synthetase
MKSSNSIRREFIQFFENKNHTFVKSSPVIPHEDPTLLFTNAGMNQFKDVFLGQGKRRYKRAVNSQKCIRVSGKHNDLEEVGHDTYHHTFFEMLGNWSFGDYYKKEAIKWAWQLFTDIWKLPSKKLWSTVYIDDEEAESHWKNYTNIDPSHVLRFDEKDNFWEMGATGPCGPSSEIHIDLGPEYCDKKHIKNHKCEVNGGCRRFIELWNLVFIQYNRDETGNLRNLPERHVDTGMGFERIVAVLQDKASNYDTDIFKPLIEEVERFTNLKYDRAQQEEKIAFRVLADHIRMLTFAIGDGAIPSNEGRGYVLRRILRRAARYARKLGMHHPFIYKLTPVVVEIMGESYPEVKERIKHIMEVIKSEEISFNKTLDRGIEIFEGISEKVKSRGERLIPGKEAFRLYDTYGFPLDLTKNMAEEQNLVIDEEEFDREMENQRERARKAGKFSTEFDHVDNWNVLKHCMNSSNFVGYDKLETESSICKFAKKNGQYQFILTETPFYAESGGQIADKGKIILEENELEVIDVQKDGEDIIHICTGPEDLNIVHSKVLVKVNEKLRHTTMYNHTSTHLLHEALRRTVGDHVQQAGSLVTPDRFRFDFTHFKTLDKKVLEEIEGIVNEQIRQDKEVHIYYTSFEEAKKGGAIALFGEKYSEQVRVVEIENFSKELCGGTHVKHTGQIGSFVILQETGIASGVRRIEAITGPKALEYTQKARHILSELTQILNCTIEELPEKINSMTEQIKVFEKRFREIQSEDIVGKIDSIINNAEKINDTYLAVRDFKGVDIDLLKNLADIFRKKVKSGVILLINQSGQKFNFVCSVTDELIEQGFHAGDLVNEIAKMAGGGGGGRPHIATAGAKNIDKVEDGISLLRDKLRTIKKK